MIVPVYNVAPYLAACLDSLLAQTFRDFEIVLVEDGSTDGSQEMAEQYAAKDARVRLVEHRWNHGVAAARNLGLELVHSKYVAFADADDVLVPTTLQVLHQAAETEQTDIVQAGYQEFCTELGDGAATCWAEQAILLPAKISMRIRCLLPLRLHVAPWGKLFRKTFLDMHHLHFSDAPMAEDLSFHYEGLLTAERYLVLPDNLYHYRVRPDSTDRVQGMKRVERFVVTMARTLEDFRNWEQGECSLTNLREQQQALRALYVYCMIQLQKAGEGCKTQELLVHCQKALAGESCNALQEAMFYMALRQQFYPKDIEAE